MTLRVNVTDIETGDSDSCDVQEGDYVLIVHAPCKRAKVEVLDDGATHIITVTNRTAR